MRKQHLPYLGLGALLVASFVVVHWIYGYVIAFQSETNDCFFMFWRPFLTQFTDHPGGLVCYAGHFLGQFYHYPWLGALIVSAWIVCFGLLFHRVLVKLKTPAGVSGVLFPSLMLLGLHTSPIWLLHDTLGLCASCAAYWGYLSSPEKTPRRVYALLVTPVAYLLLGVYAWFFVAGVVASEWLSGPLRTGLAFKLGYLLLAAALPLIAWRWGFLIPLQSALAWPLTIIPPHRAGVLHYTVTQFAVDCSLGGLFTASVFLIPLGSRYRSGNGRQAPRPAKTSGWSRAVVPALLVVLAVSFHLVRYDGSLSTMTTCRRFYLQGNWDAILAEVKGRPFLDVDSQLMTNLALSKKGKLLDEMFRYPQVWGPRGLVANFSGKTIRNPAENDTYRAMYNSDLFYELGHVNLALQHAYDYITAMGETDAALKRMAECSMANGNYEMASKYLNRLETTLFGRAFARRSKAIIAAPDAAEREFAAIRNRYPVADVSFRDSAVLHLAALPVSPEHHVAFDYLTAWLLLEKTKASLDTICHNIKAFQILGFASIPTHCQEMLVLWERQEGTSLDLHGYRYDEAVVARVDQFLQDLSQDRDSPVGAQRLWARYGDTYMFYCFCVPTPSEFRQRFSVQTDSGSAPREE